MTREDGDMSWPLRRAARLHARSVAVVDGEREVTYSELEHRVGCLGAALVDLGDHRLTTRVCPAERRAGPQAQSHDGERYDDHQRDDGEDGWAVLHHAASFCARNVPSSSS